jgi:hypothetical protein
MRIRTTFKDDDDREQYWDRVLDSPIMDQIAKALDAKGWMIIGQPQPDDPPDYNPCWPMNKPSADCPSWADNGPSAVIVPLRDQIAATSRRPRRSPVGGLRASRARDYRRGPWRAS